MTPSALVVTLCPRGRRLLALQRLEIGAVAVDHREEAAPVAEASDRDAALRIAAALVRHGVGLDRRGPSARSASAGLGIASIAGCSDASGALQGSGPGSVPHADGVLGHVPAERGHEAALGRLAREAVHHAGDAVHGVIVAGSARTRRGRR